MFQNKIQVWHDRSFSSETNALTENINLQQLFAFDSKFGHKNFRGIWVEKVWGNKVDMIGYQEQRSENS